MITIESSTLDLPFESGEKKERTRHIRATDFASWLRSAPAGSMLVYAHGVVTRDAQAGGELGALANSVQDAAMAGTVELTQSASAPASRVARPFAYRAHKREFAGPPAWRSGWGNY